MESFGTRLKRLRTEKQLTAKQMSLMTGIPLSTYREWENGRQIKGQPYVNLAHALDVSLYELLTGESPPRVDSIELIAKIERDLKILRQALQRQE